VVEVEVQDADERVISSRRRYRPFELFDERATVGKTGQVVSHGLFPQAGVGFVVAFP
jgi:hypothetical protein